MGGGPGQLVVMHTCLTATQKGNTCTPRMTTILSTAYAAGAFNISLTYGPQSPMGSLWATITTKDMCDSTPTPCIMQKPSMRSNRPYPKKLVFISVVTALM